MGFFRVSFTASLGDSLGFHEGFVYEFFRISVWVSLRVSSGVERVSLQGSSWFQFGFHLRFHSGFFKLLFRVFLRMLFRVPFKVSWFNLRFLYGYLMVSLELTGVSCRDFLSGFL